MPNVKSAAKRVRTNRRANLRGRAVRSMMRTAIRRVNEAIETNDAEKIDGAMRKALSVIGVTARKGCIHRKKASRLSSRLRLRVNRAMKDIPAAD